MADLPDVNHIHPLDDFVQGGKDFLPSGFLDDKANFIRLMETYLERLKVLDDSIVEMAEGRTLANATGVNLDEIGNQMGIARAGLEDSDYRVVIMIMSAASKTSGTRGELIATLNQIFGNGNFKTWKGENYRFDINIFDACFDVVNVIPNILDMLPMPTHLRITENEGFSFGFNGDNDSVGFSSVADPVTTGTGGIASQIYVSDDENS